MREGKSPSLPPSAAPAEALVGIVRRSSSSSPSSLSVNAARVSSSSASSSLSCYTCAACISANDDSRQVFSAPPTDGQHSMFFPFLEGLTPPKGEYAKVALGSSDFNLT